jgi:hypothetical protein
LFPQTNQVDNKSAHRLHDRVADLKGADDVGILLGDDRHLLLEFRSEHP